MLAEQIVYFSDLWGFVHKGQHFGAAMRIIASLLKIDWAEFVEARSGT